MTHSKKNNLTTSLSDHSSTERAQVSVPAGAPFVWRELCSLCSFMNVHTKDCHQCLGTSFGFVGRPWPPYLCIVASVSGVAPATGRIDDVGSLGRLVDGSNEAHARAASVARLKLKMTVISFEPLATGDITTSDWTMTLTGIVRVLCTNCHLRGLHGCGQSHGHSTPEAVCATCLQCCFGFMFCAVSCRVFRRSAQALLCVLLP